MICVGAGGGGGGGNFDPCFLFSAVDMRVSFGGVDPGSMSISIGSSLSSETVLGMFPYPSLKGLNSGIGGGWSGPWLTIASFGGVTTWRERKRLVRGKGGNSLKSMFGIGPIVPIDKIGLDNND